MRRQRVELVVAVDLDPIAGFGHEPDDWRRAVEAHLANVAAAYRPTVAVSRVFEPVVEPRPRARGKW